jgi:hypothetical protein
MVCPKPHNSTPGARPVLAALSVRESNDNIPNGSQPVRVQTVNVNRSARKCGIKFFQAIFIKMNPLFCAGSAPG